MIIDSETYRLTDDNYISVGSLKKQIVLGHTSNHDMKHIVSWNQRYNGFYKKTAPFTIAYDGTIYQHFDPKYQSLYFNSLDLNKKSIVILLDNDGWLTRNKSKDEYYNWKGDIYNQTVVSKLWRGHDMWANYSDEQLDATIRLVKHLCDEFYIPKEVFGHNTKVDGLFDYKGVLYKSNLNKNNTDLSPSWDFKKFKNNIETK
jgi:N-acetyl-anhydromuramyl-L-alanine amidase AmpD